MHNKRTILDVIDELHLTTGNDPPHPAADEGESRLNVDELEDPASFGRWWGAFAAWPPDVFALTSILLADSGAYRHVTTARDVTALRQAGREWRTWASEVASSNLCGAAPRVAVPFPKAGKIGERLERAGERLGSAARVCVHEMANDVELCRAVLDLHALADEACADMGIPDAHKADPRLAREGGEGAHHHAYFQLMAERRLVTRGSLCMRVAPDVIKVLPKVKTPQTGITVRSLSHYLSAHRSEASVNWNVNPRWAIQFIKPEVRRINLLLVPWPFEIAATAFIQREGRDFFGYAPEADPEAVLHTVRATVKEAKRKVRDVHGVILPEAALVDAEFKAIAAELHKEGIGFFLAGVRSDGQMNGADGERRPGTNKASLALSFFADVEMDRPRWYRYDQDKHHRWALDGGQIRQYELGFSLHPNVKLWEDIDVPARSIDFVVLNSWLTMCHLICEDLAQIEPISNVIRAVGPNLVIALLLDGPQMERRWPGRYASVLADDPGASVLTLTSLGMIMRSDRAGAQVPSRSIGLWKQAHGIAHELSLAPGAQALVLSLAAIPGKQYTADGRDSETFSLALSGVEQIRPGSTAPATGETDFRFETPTDARAVSVLCFLVDALVKQPDRYSEFIKEAREGLRELKDSSAVHDHPKPDFEELERALDGIAHAFGAADIRFGPSVREAYRKDPKPIFKAVLDAAYAELEKGGSVLARKVVEWAREPTSRGVD